MTPTNQKKPSAVSEELRLRVMRVLEENPQATQREIAAELGVSLGGINYCVKALISMGWVKLNNFAKSDKKMGYAYILTPAGVSEKAEITTRFLKKKMMEYGQLKKEIEQLKNEVAQR